MLHDLVKLVGPTLKAIIVDFPIVVLHFFYFIVFGNFSLSLFGRMRDEALSL